MELNANQVIVGAFLALLTGLSSWTLLTVVDVSEEVAVVKRDVEIIVKSDPLSRSEISAVLATVELRIKTLADAQQRILNRLRVLEDDAPFKQE